jgi:hypothetical protein
MKHDAQTIPETTGEAIPETPPKLWDRNRCGLRSKRPIYERGDLSSFGTNAIKGWLSASNRPSPSLGTHGLTPAVAPARRRDSRMPTLD